MSSYCTLEVGKKYLKNLDALAADPQDGITQEDLTEAEEAAKNYIDLELGDLFSKGTMAGWTVTPPPTIEDTACRLASAEVIMLKFSRDGVAGPDGYVDWLTEGAVERLEKIKTGEAPLRDASGNVIQPQVDLRPRVKNREDMPFSGRRYKRRQFPDGR